MPGLTPGDWTSTGWGAQHRVRAVEGDRVTLVCHSADQWAHDSRMDTAAEETERCSRCTAAPGLGPLSAPALGEVRRNPAGVVVACLRMWDGREPRSADDRCWQVLDPAGTSALGPLNSYDVAGWEVCGAVPGITTSVAA